MKTNGITPVPAERVLFLAVGVPEAHPEAYGRAAINALQSKGFAVKTMDLGDITEQARHIEQTLNKVKEQMND